MKIRAKNNGFVKAFLISLLVFVSIVIIGCSAQFQTFPMPGEAQDISYTVKGNGSQAIQYGNYVYFANGFSGYDDTDGNQNTDVTKGAVFRTELYGKKADKTTTAFGVVMGNDFEIQTRMQSENMTQESIDLHNSKADDKDKIVDEDYIFKADRQLERVIDAADVDEDDDATEIVDSDKYINQVNVNRLSNKRIGTSGYKTGGMWIFDDYLYYATPSNERDKNGTVVYEKTEFYRVSLDGKSGQRVYKTSANANSSPYGFYKQNGKVYLVVLDGEDIVSVAMGNKVEKPMVIAQNVTKAIMPSDSLYYQGYNELNGQRRYTANDYIFFSRPVDGDDTQRTGNVVEMMRADGKHRIELFETGRDTDIESVRNGLLFYKDIEDGQQKIKYTNVYHSIENPLYSGLVEGTAVTYASDEFDSFYNFRTSERSDGAFSLAVNSSGITFFDGDKSQKIYDGTATILFVNDNYVYFLGSGTDEQGNAIENMVLRKKYDGSSQVEQMSAQSVSVDSLYPTVVADCIVYIGKLDEYADGYTFFKKIPPLNGESQELFVGQRLDSELRQNVKDDSTT